MARLVVLGGGVSGHTAATFAREWLGKEHDDCHYTKQSMELDTVQYLGGRW